MKKTLLFTLILVTANTLKAGTFTSFATGPWNAAGSWTAVGDADGIPDNDDDITIQVGHIISITGTGHKCNDLIVNGTLNLNGGCNAHVLGSYTLNGSETGTNGSLSFLSASGTISGSGTFGTQVRYSFVGSNYTIAADVNMLKSIVCSAGNGIITNNGYVRFNRIYGGNETWINAAGATLEFNSPLISAWDVDIDATAVGNTIYYSNATGAVNMLPTLGNVYDNLSISGGFSSKFMTSDITINGDLSFPSVGTLNQNGFNINLLGDFNKPFGNIVQTGTSKLIFSGTSPQTLVSAVSPFSLNSIQFDNPTTVTITSGFYNILRSIEFTQGTISVGTNRVTLVSNATNTAIVGPSNATVIGSLIAQRFISARAAGYSDMSGCMVGQTLNDWDDDLLLIYTYAPPNFFPSVFGYDETAFDYVPITSSAQTLDPGVGFEVYLDSDGSYTTFNATTIDNTGVPFIGDLDMSGYVTFNNDGWNLLGNPYHANLDFDLFGDATLDIAGDMLVYDEVSEDFITVSGGAGELFAPNQGFWVNVTGPSPFITFSESHKSTSNSSNFRHKKTSMFTLRLKSVDQTKYTSGTSFRFTTEPETAGKWGSLPFKKVPHPDAPAFCSKSTEGKDLKINLLNSTENTISVPMKFTVGLSGIYTIEQQNIESANAEGYNCITLYDNVLNKAIDIANENYQFYAEKGEADNRFTLVMSKNGDCKKSETIVVNSTEVDINRIGDNTLVKLNFETETGVSIRITDLLGQNISPSQALVASVQDVYVPIPADFYGIYLVTVSYNNKTITRKLYK